MEMKAVRDRTATGLFHCYTVGNIRTSISGALYVDPELQLPDELIIKFINPKEEPSDATNS